MAGRGDPVFCFDNLNRTKGRRQQLEEFVVFQFGKHVSPYFGCCASQLHE
jgi:hypothetical protein